MMKPALAAILALLMASCATPSDPADRVTRIPPKEVRNRMEGHGALLVCAYPADKCLGTHLAGAMSLEELEAKVPALKPDQEIIFFCGCHHEETAAQRAVEYESKGFRRVGVVGGGILAWVLEGYELTKTQKGGAR